MAILKRWRLAGAALLAAPLFLAACRTRAAEVKCVASLQEFVQEAKNQAEGSKAGEGSLWVNRGRRSDLFRDLKAREVNDVVTIQVLENTQATATAEASSDRATEAKAGFNGLFGLQGSIKELPSLVDGSSSSKFGGKGSTTRETILRTFITARVVDTLPNGYLVVEGTRDIRVNSENQSLQVLGIVRPEDISRTNVVPSSAIGQMTIRLQGKGSVSRPINPGWLYKILNGIMPF